MTITRNLFASSALIGAVLTSNVHALSFPSMPSIEGTKNVASSVWNWKTTVSVPKTNKSFNVSTKGIAGTAVASLLVALEVKARGSHIKTAYSCLGSVFGAVIHPINTVTPLLHGATGYATAGWTKTKTTATVVKAYVESNNFSKFSGSFYNLGKAVGYTGAGVGAAAAGYGHYIKASAEAELAKAQAAEIKAKLAEKETTLVGAN